MIAFHGDNFEYKPETLSIYEEDDIVTSLKEEGIGSEKGKEILSDWLDKKQKEADESESKYSRIKYAISVAEFYFRLELFVEAMMYVEDAWSIVDNEMRDDDSDELEIMVTYLIYLNEKLDEKK